MDVDALYRRERPRLYATALALCGSEAWAEDLVHEAFLTFWERRGRIAPLASPAAYLATMVRNLWLNQRERRARRVEPPRTAPSDHDRATVVRDAVAALEDDLREVLTLHRHAGMSYREIADALGVSIKTVEARMTRAFNELRSRLRPLLGGDER